MGAYLTPRHRAPYRRPANGRRCSCTMRLLRALRWPFARAAPPAAASPCDACPLGACAPGSLATVLCIACPAHDAQRLRTLGLFEGAKVGIVDARSGMVLDVRGARLALGDNLVAAITVRPVSG